MSESKSTPQQNRTIVAAFDQEKYPETLENPIFFRIALKESIDAFPELFPPEIKNGYKMKDIRYSKKSGIFTRRIVIGSIAYTVRPSFIMPYHTAFTNDVEKTLFLRKFEVPYWALSYVFGKNSMHWYRMEQNIGRNSLVGTTVKDPNLLPEHLGADEKHSRLKGKKVYVGTTVGDECILGASVKEDAGEESLTKAYGIFKEEALNINPAYSPKSVNTDGWKATINAWKGLFPFIAVICCFLHIFIKIRDRSKKKYSEYFQNVSDKLWECYKAESKASFSQRVRRLYEWAKKESKLPDVILKPITKLKKNLSDYSQAYDLPGCHRTSNMIDRLMQRMDRHLFSTFYFHGDLCSAELGIRAWALIHNFAPCNPYTVKKHNGLKSPAERLNKFRYHDNWLQNLLISASLGGYRDSPPNPL